MEKENKTNSTEGPVQTLVYFASNRAIALWMGWDIITDSPSRRHATRGAVYALGIRTCAARGGQTMGIAISIRYSVAMKECIFVLTRVTENVTFLYWASYW